MDLLAMVRSRTLRFVWVLSNPINPHVKGATSGKIQKTPQFLQF
jgi:hypothetical protein